MRIPEHYHPEADLLQDRVILITGAGSGIGRVAALTFALYGATVVLLGRQIPKLEAVYDEIKHHGHPEPAIYPLNLEGASPKDYEELAAVIESKLGRLDGILHNAAILGQPGPIQHYDIDIWHKVMQVNLNAPFILSRACIPLLQQSDTARILFTSHPLQSAYWGAYGASKAGLEALMKILADELNSEHFIGVNMINPGAVNSPMNQRALPGKKHDVNPNIEALMPAYLYLLGRDSAKLSGEKVDAL